MEQLPEALSGACFLVVCGDYDYLTVTMVFICIHLFGYFRRPVYTQNFLVVGLSATKIMNVFIRMCMQPWLVMYCCVVLGSCLWWIITCPVVCEL